MSTLLLIKNNIIENIIEAELSFTRPGYRTVDASGLEADIGWAMSGNVPIKPTPPELSKPDQIREAASVRDFDGDRPITLPGKGIFSADMKAIGNLRDAIEEWDAIQLVNGGLGTISWPAADGSSVALTLSDLTDLKSLIILRNHQLRETFKSSRSDILR